MLQKNQEKIKEITDKIVNEFQPDKIILFGSYAWGEPDENSDVDLLVIKNSQKSKFERGLELRKLLSFSKMALDTLVYTPKEIEESINKNHNFFMEDIVRNGKILYQKFGGVEIILPNRPLTILQ